MDQLLWRKIEQGPPDECWLWTGARTGRGYGHVNRLVNGRPKFFQAHRLAYESVHGPLPEGQIICHSCDTRLCCNPAHLWPGSAKDNTQDMIRKGRHRMFGSAVGSRLGKLTDAQVREIRASSDSGRSLATRYKVGQSTISRIKRGAVYRDI